MIWKPDLTPSAFRKYSYFGRKITWIYIQNTEILFTSATMNTLLSTCQVSLQWSKKGQIHYLRMKTDIQLACVLTSKEGNNTSLILDSALNCHFLFWVSWICTNCYYWCNIIALHYIAVKLPVFLTDTPRLLPLECSLRKHLELKSCWWHQANELKTFVVLLIAITSKESEIKYY
jgi:hypothetical protein